MKWIILYIIIFISSMGFSQGIIIADEFEQTKIFGEQNEKKIVDFVNEISSKYNKVILHLGRSYVFRKGNIFSTAIAKKNLNSFCSLLKDKNIPVYLWFLDSYGSENFINIYSDYKNIITENTIEIGRLGLNYEGIVCDLEWINKENYDNTERLIELLAFLKEKIKDKKLLIFTSLIDNENSNLKRGYDVGRILKYADNIIEMLYIKDGGFYTESSTIVPYLLDSRIKELKKYFKKKKWILAISVEGGILKKSEEEVDFLKTQMNENDSYFQHLKLKRTHKKRNYIIKDLIAIDDFFMDKNNGTKVKISKGDYLYLFSVRTDKLVQQNDFIWEYFIYKK